MPSRAAVALGLHPVRVTPRPGRQLAASTARSRARPIGGYGQALRFERGVVSIGFEDPAADCAREQMRELTASGGSAVMMIPIPRSGVYRGSTGWPRRASAAIDEIQTAKADQPLLTLPEERAIGLFSRGTRHRARTSGARRARAASVHDRSTFRKKYEITKNHVFVLRSRLCLRYYSVWPEVRRNAIILREKSPSALDDLLVPYARASPYRGIIFCALPRAPSPADTFVIAGRLRRARAPVQAGCPSGLTQLTRAALVGDVVSLGWAPAHIAIGFVSVP